MMKVTAFSFNEPISAGIVASVHNRILTIENVILWRSDNIYKIVQDLDTLKRFIYIDESPIQTELREAYKIIKISGNDLELSKDLYSELIRDNRLKEKKICDVAIPYVWDAMVILLSGINVQLSKNYSIGTAETGATSKTEGLISLVNGNSDEFEPGDPFYINRNRYTPPYWYY